MTERERGRGTTEFNDSVDKCPESQANFAFPFRSSASEVREKRPVDTRTLGDPCLTNAKSFESLHLVWTG